MNDVHAGGSQPGRGAKKPVSSLKIPRRILGRQQRQLRGPRHRTEERFGLKWFFWSVHPFLDCP
jgi:hypothetical protein